MHDPLRSLEPVDQAATGAPRAVQIEALEVPAERTPAGG
jgi:hypothetical protein